jgi:hypothetical protein
VARRDDFVKDGAVSATPAAPSKGRIVGARTLTVLAAIIALVGSIAFYLERTVLSEDGFNEIATQMIQSPEIRNQVAAKAVEELNANVDVEQEIANRLPEAQKALAPVLAGIVEQGAQEAANRLLERPRLQELFVRTATSTQRQVVKLLDDEGKFVRTSNGTIYLDLRPIVVEIGQQSAIASRLAERLPEDAGQIKLIDADQLDAAQTITRILRFLADWLVVVALAVAALAVWVARGRRRIELRAIGIALLVVGVLELLFRRLAGTYLVDKLTTDATRPAGDDAWSIITQGLADRAWIAIVLGLLLLVGVWLVGPGSLSARARRLVAPVAEKPLWTYGAVAALVVVLATLVPVFQRGWLSFLVFLVLLVIGVEVLRRFVLAEQGVTTAPTPAAPTPPPATGS